MNDQSKTLYPVGKDGRISSTKLLPLVYDELRRLAKARMATVLNHHTLQPTELVHEAWLRTVGDADRTWENRSHFIAAAAVAMRRILVEHARRKARVKRGGNRQRMEMDPSELADVETDEKILLVEDVLTRLERVHPEWAKIVVMKYFGGMTQPEIAEALGMGERSIRRYWSCARAWLYDCLRSETE